jgi:hypothetical protein
MTGFGSGGGFACSDLEVRFCSKVDLIGVYKLSKPTCIALICWRTFRDGFSA